MKDQYIKIYKKRFLHLLLAVILWLIFPVSGLIIFLIKEGMSGIIAIYWFFVVISTMIVSYNIRDYRDWIDKKYPKLDKKDEIC